MLRAASVASVIVCALIATGCTPPLHQRVAPYPGYGQTPERMYRDSAECESWARSSAGSAGDSAAGGGAGGALVGATAGAALGAIAGAFVGSAGTGAALGAALGGASGGMQGAAGGAVAQDQRLLAAYGNCMAGRGYVVNGAATQPPPQQSNGPEGRVEGTSTVEGRLLRLRQLHTDSLITDKEYRDRRRAILQDL